MAQQVLAQAEALAGAQRWAEAAAAYVVSARALDDEMGAAGAAAAALALRAGRGLAFVLSRLTAGAGTAAHVQALSQAVSMLGQRDGEGGGGEREAGGGVVRAILLGDLGAVHCAAGQFWDALRCLRAAAAGGGAAGLDLPGVRGNLQHVRQLPASAWVRAAR
jgi:hypothetical protein